MDENLNTNGNIQNIEESPEKGQKEGMEQNADNIREFAMDDTGRIRQNDIHTGTSGAATFVRNSKVFIVLGWISAALAAFASPFFAVAGIVFGVLLNRQSRGRGNVIIVVNIVLAAINIILGLFFVAMMQRMMTGY